MNLAATGVFGTDATPRPDRSTRLFILVAAAVLHAERVVLPSCGWTGGEALVDDSCAGAKEKVRRRKNKDGDGEASQDGEGDAKEGGQ